MDTLTDAITVVCKELCKGCRQRLHRRPRWTLARITWLDARSKRWVRVRLQPLDHGGRDDHHAAQQPCSDFLEQPSVRAMQVSVVPSSGRTGTSELMASTSVGLSTSRGTSATAGVVFWSAPRTCSAEAFVGGDDDNPERVPAAVAAAQHPATVRADATSGSAGLKA